MLDEKTNQKLSEIYSRFRSYLAHEDDLIYQRTTLLVTVQSFLIATFGFSYQKKYEIAFEIIFHPDTSKDMLLNVNKYNIFLLLLCMAGVSTAIVTIFAVKSASNAIKNLHKLWREAVGTYVPGAKDDYEKHIPKDFPDVIGGGLPSSAKWGVSLSFALPVLFAFFWISAAIFILLTIKLSG